MRLSGRIIKGNKIIRKTLVVEESESASYRDKLEKCLIRLCKELDIQVPLWLKKNTVEFSNYKKTSFNREHFIEKIEFDNFEIETHS